MSPEFSPNLNLQAARLAEILNLFAHQRVVVVGTTCTGKSTLQERTARRGVSFANAQNMQAQIQQALAESQLPVVHFCLD